MARSCHSECSGEFHNAQDRLREAIREFRGKTDCFVAEFTLSEVNVPLATTTKSTITKHNPTSLAVGRSRSYYRCDTLDLWGVL